MTPEWRVGRKVPRNLYRGEEAVAMLATAEQAADMAAELNENDSLRERLALAEQQRDAAKEQIIRDTNTIKFLRADNENVRHSYGLLEARLSQRQQKIEELEAKLKGAEKDLALCRIGLSEYRAGQVGTLEQKLREAEARSAQLTSLLESLNLRPAMQDLTIAFKMLGRTDAQIETQLIGLLARQEQIDFWLKEGSTPKDSPSPQSLESDEVID